MPNEKLPFLTLEQARTIMADVPTPFHIYDERGIRENARLVRRAFAWNPGYKEYFAVKATPNPYLLKILQEEGCGVDCSSCSATPAILPAGTSCSPPTRRRPRTCARRMTWGRSSTWTT